MDGGRVIVDFMYGGGMVQGHEERRQQGNKVG